MSEANKLRAGDSELTKFKELWLKPSFAPSREYWLEQFSSSRSLAELRGEILKRLKITLRWDSQLSKFRAWAEAGQQRELMAEKIEARKKELLAGGMTLEEAQDVLLTEASAYSVAARDFKLGLKVSSEISKTATLKFDQEKFKEGLRTRLETALNALAEHIKGNAAAREAYEKFKATVADTTK